MKMQKKQFKIGELAQFLDIKQFVVRFWEKEFNIKPSRSSGGHRFYTEDHLQKFTLIKDLLYEKKFTLDGAKKELKNLMEANYKEKNIIPSQKTTLEKNHEVENKKISEKDLEKTIIQLRSQLIKLKELL